ncbi:hypothetical protein KR074_005496 [Drosophila pseudoananassae]|nr:hypothetical protein KR074_005496 [Drosophila pseudoananassae]
MDSEWDEIVDLTVDSSTSCASSTENAEPVASTSQSEVSSIISGSSDVTMAEPEQGSGSAGRRAQRPQSHSRGRPVRAPKPPPKASKTIKKASNPKSSRISKRALQSTLEEAYTSDPELMVTEDTVMEDSPISIQLQRRRRSSSLNPPRRSARLNSRSGSRSRQEAIGINIRSPFTIVTHPSDDSSSYIVTPRGVTELVPLSPTMATTQNAVPKVTPRFADAGTNTSFTQLPRDPKPEPKPEPEPKPDPDPKTGGCFVM